MAKLPDQAAEKISHRSELPLIMMINLAQKTKDPERMAKAIEQSSAPGLARF